MDEFFDRIKEKWEALKRYCRGIVTDWRENRRPRAVGKIILPLIPVVLGVALLAFLWHIREAVVKAVCGILLVLMIVYGGKSRDNKTDKPSDAVVLKHAKQGLDNLLDILLVVGENLERQTYGTYTIQCPKTKGQLAYPHKNRCITVKDGVASITVAFYYTGEVDKDHFKGRANDCIGQMLNAYELPSRPNPVFYDKDNVPHTSIQAIHADIVGDRIILEVIRVTQEAIPLLDELDRAEGDGTNDQGTLYDDDL